MATSHYFWTLFIAIYIYIKRNNKVILENITIDQYDDIKTQLNRLTIIRLKELCRDNGLPISGNKFSLVQRLSEIFGD